MLQMPCSLQGKPSQLPCFILKIYTQVWEISSNKVIIRNNYIAINVRHVVCIFHRYDQQNAAKEFQWILMDGRQDSLELSHYRLDADGEETVMWKLIVFHTLGHRCRRLTRIVNIKEQLCQTSNCTSELTESICHS